MKLKQKVKALIGYGLIAYATWKLVKNKANPKMIINDVKSDVKAVAENIEKVISNPISETKKAVKTVIQAPVKIVKTVTKPLKFKLITYEY